MNTMFLLLFMTSLVGLYVASRELKRGGRGFLPGPGVEPAKSEKPPELEPGLAYLVTQGHSRALKLFTREIQKGRPGLCVTRTFPENLRQSWDLEGATVVWLANGPAESREAVDSLESLSRRLHDFLAETDHGIILLDGVEYLFVHNSFTEVMKLLQSVKDALPPGGAQLILPVDLLALVERQRALLTREFPQA